MIIAKFKTIFIWTLMAVLLMTPMLSMPTKVLALGDSSFDVRLVNNNKDVELSWTETDAMATNTVKTVIKRNGKIIATKLGILIYTDKGVKDGSWGYQVFAYDSSGGLTGQTPVKTVTITTKADGTRVSNDTQSGTSFDVKLVNDNKDVNLSWTETPEMSTNTVKIVIKRNGTVIATKGGIVYYTDKAVPDGSWAYQVFGYDSDGGLTGRTAVKTVTITTKADGTRVAHDTATPSPDSDTGTGENPCDDKSGVVWYAPSTWVSGTIGNAICQMQVALITWESQMLCVVVNGVLLPTLGLENEAANPKTCNTGEEAKLTAPATTLSYSIGTSGNKEVAVVFKH